MKQILQNYFNRYNLALLLMILSVHANAQNNGTKLTVLSNIEEIKCVSHNSAVVEISTIITSTGSVDSASINNNKTIFALTEKLVCK